MVIVMVMVMGSNLKRHARNSVNLVRKGRNASDRGRQAGRIPLPSYMYVTYRLSRRRVRYVLACGMRHVVVVCSSSSSSSDD